MKRFLRENFFGALFLLALTGQAIAGHIAYNDEQLLATIWVLQKGSPESKPLDESGRESDEEQMIGPHAKPDSPLWARMGGWRAGLYGNSLLIVMALIFLGSWLAQSLTGWNAYNQEQLDHGAAQISWIAYLGNAEFWETETISKRSPA